MALGRIADINLALTSTIGGGAWSPDLPVTNMITDRRFVAAPARCLAIGSTPASRFDLTLERPTLVNLVALIFHTLSPLASYRVVVAGPDLDLDNPIYTSPLTPVYSRLYPSMNLPWEDPNWWTGQAVSDSDLALYPRHLWIPLPAGLVAGRIQVRLIDPDNPAGFYDIGGVWATRAWTPGINFDRGRQPTVEVRNVSDEGPSGRLFAEEREPRRRHQLTWSRLTDAEVQRLFDAGARARSTRPVLVMPDLDDPALMAREAFPAVFDPTPKPTLKYSGLNTVTAGFKEIIA